VGDRLIPRSLLALVPATFLLLGLAAPLAWIVLLSVGFPNLTLHHFQQVLGDETYARVLGRTFAIAGTSTLFALLLGYPVAYVLARAKDTRRSLLLWFVLLPLWTNLLVRTYAWMIILTTKGPLNSLILWLGLADHPLELTFNRTGTIIGLTHSLLPYVIIPIYAALLKIDEQLTRAAQSLGARPAATFFRVTLPLSLPGVGAGCVLGFVLGLAAYVIPALLGGPRDRMAGMLIESTVNKLLDWNLTAALAVTLLAVTLVVVFIQARLLGLGALFGVDLGTTPLNRTRRFVKRAMRCAREVWPVKTWTHKVRDRSVPDGSQDKPMPLVRTRSRPTFDQLMMIIAGGTFVFLALPLLIVIPVSFSSSQYLQFPPTGFSLQWYSAYLSSGRWLAATGTSVVVAALVVVVSLTVGSAAAIAVTRDRGHGKLLLSIGCLAPLVIPNLVLAVAFFFVFSKVGLVGTVAGLVVAHSVLSLPLVFIAIVSGLRSIDPSIPRAAAVLGARPFKVVFRILVPLMIPSILTASLFAFVHSFDEVVVAIFLTSLSVTTLPKLIWENIVNFIDPTISAVSTILILLATIAVAVTQRLQGRSMRHTNG
jgi:putative spermidine/putrescine transport system permease protein